MCENLHCESVYVYFKELHNDQEYYWPTIYRAGEAAVSTILLIIGFTGTPTIHFKLIITKGDNCYYKVRQLTTVFKSYAVT